MWIYLKNFLKNVLEIVLEAEILEPYEVSDFEKGKTPKALDNQVESICKLACKDAHTDCSASLCLRQRNAKRHLEKGDARGGVFYWGFQRFLLSYIFVYFTILSDIFKRLENRLPTGTWVRIPLPPPIKTSVELSTEVFSLFAYRRVLLLRSDITS